MVLPEYLIHFDYITEEKPEIDYCFIENTILTSWDPKVRFDKPGASLEKAKIAEKKLAEEIANIKKLMASKSKGKNLFLKSIFLFFIYKIDPAYNTISLFKHQDIKNSSLNFLQIPILNFLQMTSATDPQIEKYSKSKQHLLKQIDKKINPPNSDLLELIITHRHIGAPPELQSLSKLQLLNLSFCNLTNCNFLSNISTLNQLLLTGNKISSIPELSHMMQLRCINLSFNHIININKLQDLAKNVNLVKLEVRGNPFCYTFVSYKEILVKMLPGVEQLNNRSAKIISDRQKEDLKIRLGREVAAELLEIEEAKIENLTEIFLIKKNIGILDNFNKLPNLKRLNLSLNKLQKLEHMDCFPNLEEFRAEKNFLTNIDKIGDLTNLKKLELGSNYIEDLGIGFSLLKGLNHLSLENNRIQDLTGLKSLENLLELYMGENLVKDLKQIRNLAPLKNLIVLDLWGNPVSIQTDYRLFVIFHINELKVLDGVSVSETEAEESNEAFTGRLSDEVLQMKLAGQDLSKLQVMSFEKCNLRVFDSIFTQEKFPSVVELNLAGNQFSNFRCFKNLPKLKILNLSHNVIDTFEPLAEPKLKFGINAFPVSFFINF